MTTIRDIELVIQPLKTRWELTKLELAEMGIEVMEVETLRPQAIQNAYYAQGREPVRAVNIMRKKVGLWLLVKRDEHGRPIRDEHGNYIPDEKQNKIITNAKESVHQYGCALDFVIMINGKPSWDIKGDINNDHIPDYENVGRVAKRYGLQWGGDFTFKDYVHVQYVGDLTLGDLRAGKRPEDDVLDYI